MGFGVSITNDNKSFLPASWSGVTATGKLPKIFKAHTNSCYQVIVTGTGAVTAIVLFEVSLVPNPSDTDWISPGMATVTLNGTTKATDGFASNSTWLWVRPNVTGLTGTNATLTIYEGH